MSRDTSMPAAGSEQDLADGTSPGLHAFARLDALLWQAMAAARIRFGIDAGSDPFRGLYLSADQAADSLGREAEPVFSGGNHHEAVHLAYRDFVRLAKPTFGAFSTRAPVKSH